MVLAGSPISTVTLAHVWKGVIAILLREFN